MYRFAVLLLATIVFLAASATAQAADEKPFLAGAATSNITAWLGDGLVGNFGTPPPAKYVHDELYARCFVLDDGTTRIALVVSDNNSEIGLELKARNPFKPSFTMELANGGYGYLPTPEQHKLGGYETWLGTNKVEEQASVKIVDALLEMFAELRKGKTPNDDGNSP